VSVSHSPQRTQPWRSRSSQAARSVRAFASFAVYTAPKSALSHRGNGTLGWASGPERRPSCENLDVGMVQQTQHPAPRLLSGLCVSDTEARGRTFAAATYVARRKGIGGAKA
jgi:hypothetical protein